MSAVEASTEGLSDDPPRASASPSSIDDDDFDPDAPPDVDIVDDESEEDDQSAGVSSASSEEGNDDDEADVPITGEELERLRLESDNNDEEMLLEIYKDTRDAVDQATAESYVSATGRSGEALLDKLKSPFVATPDGDVHKKRIVSLINKGQDLRRNSTDRDKRVRNVLRHSSGKGNDTLVANAFQFGEGERQRWVGPDAEDEAESGADRVKSDDICAVLVRAKVAGSSSKKAVMLICKISRLGPPTSRAQLQHSWDRSKPYRATVIVYGSKQYVPASGNPSIEPVAGESVQELPCIDSSCIILLSPSSEEWATVESTVPSTTDYFKINDLEEVFRLLLLQGKHHDVKDTPIVPLMFESKHIFVGDLRPGSTHAAEVCNVCNPPQPITTDKMNDTERHRAIKNHMASHYFQQPWIIKGSEPCAYCLGSCHAILSTTQPKKNQIMQGGDIPPGAIVRPNCQVYAITPFKFKELKSIQKKYLSSNSLVYCPQCDDFVWSYNLKSHFNTMTHRGDLPDTLKSKLPSADEKEKVQKNFPIKVPAASPN